MSWVTEAPVGYVTILAFVLGDLVKIGVLRIVRS